MRMTKNRKTILELLKKENKPMSAELILNSLPKNIMDLSTVYRSLEYLFNNNYLLKSTLGQTTYYHLNKKDHQHFMQCVSCGKLVELNCVLHDYKKELEKENDLIIISHNLTYYGYCKNCKYI